MTPAYLTHRVQIPPHLCWPGKVQFLEEGEGIVVIAPVCDRPGLPSLIFECMTLAGPFRIPADAFKLGKWPNIFHFQCPLCSEPQTLRVELATVELQPRECTHCRQTHLVALDGRGHVKTFKPGRDS